MISLKARDLLSGTTTALYKAKNMTQLSRVLAGASLAMMLAPAMAAPTLISGTTLSIYDMRAPNANGALIGDPAVVNVTAEQAAFKGGLAPGARPESFATAPYVVEAPVSAFVAKPLTSGFGVLGGGTLSLGLGTHYVDTQLTQPFTPAETNGRYDPTTTPCDMPVDTDLDVLKAKIEACQARWFETSGDFTIDFGGSFSAFGFFGTDFGDFGGSLTMALLDEFGDVSIRHTFSGFDSNTNGALGFFGFMDSQQSYSGVRLTVNQSGDNRTDYFGFDDLILGNIGQSNPVPEPGSLALVGASLLALSATRRRRKA